MKSNLFKRVNTKKIFDDLLLLAKLDTPYLVDLKELIFEKGTKGLIPDEDDFLNIAKKGDFTVEEINKIFQVSTFMILQEKEMDDSLDDIYYDLLSDQRFTEKTIELIKDKMNILKPSLTNAIEASNKQTAISDSIPSLSYFSASCSIMTRFEPEYDSEKDTPEKYTCKLIDTIPVVILQMDIDNFGTTENISFSLDENELSSFINELRLAKVQFDILKNSIKKLDR